MKTYSMQELEALRASCGCKTGMITMLICIAAAVVYFRFGSDVAPFHEHPITATAIFGLLGAVSGKLTAMFIDRHRYERLKRTKP